MRVLSIVILLAVAAGALLSEAAPAPSVQVEVVDAETHPKSYSVGFALGQRTREGLSRDGVGVDLDLEEHIVGRSRFCSFLDPDVVVVGDLQQGTLGLILEDLRAVGVVDSR